MSDEPVPGQRWHVSSAVISVKPGEMNGVLDAVDGLEGVDIFGRDGSRIIVTIEGASTGALGDRLTEISLMPGVLAANMVFEHAEEVEETI